jgi:hypothetical protein
MVVHAFTKSLTWLTASPSAANALRGVPLKSGHENREDPFVTTDTCAWNKCVDLPGR